MGIVRGISERFLPLRVTHSVRSLTAAVSAASFVFGAFPVWAAENNPSAPTAVKPAAAVAFLTPSAARAEAEQVITPEVMRRYLTFIASDALEGRDTPSAGLDAAAQFIAFTMSRLGLKPKGDDGTYFQKIALSRLLPDKAKSSLLLTGSPTRFVAGIDFLPTMGRQRSGEGSAVESPLVYVSHGWVMPSQNIDAYKGIDVKDKIMVVSGRGFPKGVGFRQMARDPQRSSWSSPAAYAAAHGARGILYLAESADTFGLAAVRAVGRGEINPTDPAIRGDLPKSAASEVPSLLLSPDATARLFDGEKLSGAPLSEQNATGEESPAFDLRPENRVAFTAAYRHDTLYTQNVVASLDGSDPALRDQYVAFGAHYDHLGVAATPDKNGDRIYNGADDDGSGTTALLTLAEAFSRATARPRRSLLFVWHCGEEKGLWGSAFFTAHPTVPLKNIATQINIDMIGRTKTAADKEPRDADLSTPNQIFVIGSHAMSTKVGEVSDAVNKGYLDLQLDFRYDDPNDPNQFFYRSDHFNYARKGVPIIFYFDGEHVDYHQRGDEVSKIDFDKMQKVTRTIFLTATEIANLPEQPRVDKKLPFKVE